MEEIYRASNGAQVFVGDDADYEKIKDNPKFKSCRCCKYGPGGHKETLGYSSPGAPKGKFYLYAEADNRIAINVLDLDDPNMVPFKCFEIALAYIKKQLDGGYNVLVACNSGHSRGPSTGLAFLRSIGDMPHNFHKSETIYRTLYRKYDPGMGMRQQLRSHWAELQDLEIKNV
jgi:hypothetical protein